MWDTSPHWWNIFPAWYWILFPLIFCPAAKEGWRPVRSVLVPGSCCLIQGDQLPRLHSCIKCAQWRRKQALARIEVVSWIILLVFPSLPFPAQLTMSRTEASSRGSGMEPGQQVSSRKVNLDMPSFRSNLGTIFVALKYKSSSSLVIVSRSSEFSYIKSSIWLSWSGSFFFAFIPILSANVRLVGFAICLGRFLWILCLEW